MTPDVELSTAAKTGTLSGSAVSPTFHPASAKLFSVTLTFSSDAAGSIALVRTLDQGSTWATRKAGPNDLTTFPVAASTTKSVNLIDYDGGIYRFQASLTAGSVTFRAALGTLQDTGLGLIGAIPGDVTGLRFADGNLIGNTFIAFPATATAEQRSSLAASLWTPLSSEDIAGTLTGYKWLIRGGADSCCYDSLFAKISVPAAAQRCPTRNFFLGAVRELRAEYVDVVSIFDWAGRTVQSGLSPKHPTASYVSGQRRVATDETRESTGSFTDATCRYGIRFAPTFAEALVQAITIRAGVPQGVRPFTMESQATAMRTEVPFGL